MLHKLILVALVVSTLLAGCVEPGAVAPSANAESQNGPSFPPCADLPDLPGCEIRGSYEPESFVWDPILVHRHNATVTCAIPRVADWDSCDPSRPMEIAWATQVDLSGAGLPPEGGLAILTLRWGDNQGIGRAFKVHIAHQEGEPPRVGSLWAPIGPASYERHEWSITFNVVEHQAMWETLGTYAVWLEFTGSTSGEATDVRTLARDWPFSLEVRVQPGVHLVLT
jgi:hypothetical protein